MSPWLRDALRLWAVWAAVWLILAFGTKPTVRREGPAGFLLQRLFLLPGYALLFLPVSAAGLASRWLPGLPGVGWAGLALCAAGLLYSVWARGQLGSNWSGIVTLKAGHELVQSGPYAHSRHPIYTGLLAASLGLAAARGTLGALLGFALACAAFGIKMSVEERFMRDEFGAAYGDYAARVKKIIPYVY